MKLEIEAEKRGILWKENVYEIRTLSLTKSVLLSFPSFTLRLRISTKGLVARER